MEKAQSKYKRWSGQYIVIKGDEEISINFVSLVKIIEPAESNTKVFK